MGNIEKLRNIAAHNGGIIDNKAAEKYGISRTTLSRLCKEQLIHRIMRGQYTFADDIQDELLSIDKRSDNIIFSHETALFLHGISDRTPFEHTITVPSDKVPSRMISSECKIYYIKPELFELGRITLKTPMGNFVSVYDLERTICDIVRSRSKIGSETFIAALKNYSKLPQKDLNKLNSYATQMKISGVVRRYLEVLL